MEMTMAMHTSSAFTPKLLPYSSFPSPVRAITLPAVTGVWRQRTKTAPLAWSKKSSFSVAVIRCGGPVREIKEDEFDDVVLKSDRPVLVEFVATWCGPCRLIAPAVQSLAQEYEDKLTVVKVDHDLNPKLIEEYKVYGLPALIVFKNGKEVPNSRREGAITKSKLKEYVDNFLESLSTV